MAQSSSFSITEQYGDCAPETVSNFLTANGAEMQLVGLTKRMGWAALTPKEAREAVAEAACPNGEGKHWFRMRNGGQPLIITVHRH